MAGAAAADGPIRSLYMTKNEQQLLVGLETGRLFIVHNRQISIDMKMNSDNDTDDTSQTSLLGHAEI